MEDDPNKREEDFSLKSLIERSKKQPAYKADDVGQTALPYQKEFIDKLKNIHEAADGAQKPKDPESLEELVRAGTERAKTAKTASRAEKGPATVEMQKGPVADPFGITERETEALETRIREGGPLARFARKHKGTLRRAAVTAAVAVAGVFGASKLFPPPGPPEPPPGPREGVTEVERINKIALDKMTIVDPLEAQLDRLAQRAERQNKKMLESGPATAGVLDGASIPEMDMSRKPDPNRIYKITRPDIQPFQGERSSLKDFNAKAKTGPKTPLGEKLASLAVPGLEGPDGGPPRNDRVSGHRTLSKAELMKKNPDGGPKAK